MTLDELDKIASNFLHNILDCNNVETDFEVIDVFEDLTNCENFILIHRVEPYSVVLYRELPLTVFLL